MKLFPTILFWSQSLVHRGKINFLPKLGTKKRISPVESWRKIDHKTVFIHKAISTTTSAAVSLLAFSAAARLTWTVIWSWQHWLVRLLAQLQTRTCLQLNAQVRSKTQKKSVLLNHVNHALVNKYLFICVSSETWALLWLSWPKIWLTERDLQFSFYPESLAPPPLFRLALAPTTIWMLS